MSKVTYIIKASENALNEKTAAIMVYIIKNNFTTAANVREALEAEYNASVVNSNIGVLIKKGLVEKSGDGLIATGEAMDIIQKAADLFAQENAPELLQKRNTRKARGVTPEMHELANFVFENIKDKVEVKEIGENRSNLEVRFAKRVLGIRQIEIRRNGSLRIFAYNMSETESKLFTSLENDVKIKIGGKYTYIDFPNVSKEIITLVTNVL